jgi:hypothetical protein
VLEFSESSLLSPTPKILPGTDGVTEKGKVLVPGLGDSVPAGCSKFWYGVCFNNILHFRC